MFAGCSESSRVLFLNICNTLELSGLVCLEGLAKFFSAWGKERIAGLWLASGGSVPRLTLCYPMNLIFQWQYIFIRFMFLMEHFLLTTRISMITKLFNIATCCKKLHDISEEAEGSCGIMWQIKYISPPAEDVYINTTTSGKVLA